MPVNSQDFSPFGFFGFGYLKSELSQKKSIKLSLSGGVFEIKRMAGNALLNAEILLKKDSFNKVISNKSFKNLYIKEKEYYAVEL